MSLVIAGKAHATPTWQGLSNPPRDLQWDQEGQADCAWQNASNLLCDESSSFWFDIERSIALNKAVYRLVESNGSPDRGWVNITAGGKTWYIIFDGAATEGIITQNADGTGGVKTDTITSDQDIDIMAIARYDNESTPTFSGVGPLDPGTFDSKTDGKHKGGIETCGLYAGDRPPSGDKQCVRVSGSYGADASKFSLYTISEANAKILKKIKSTVFANIQTRNKCDDDSGALSFLFCPLLDYSRAAVRNLIGSDSSTGGGRGFLTELLTVSPLNSSGATTTRGGQVKAKDPLYAVWVIFRDISLGLFILIFMLIIFGNGLGMEAYAIKRALPRLTMGVLFTFASYFIMQTMIDITNALGNAIPSVLAAATANTSISSYDISLNGNQQALGIIVMLIIALFALIAVIVGIAGLITRQLIIFMLVITAPFAFVCWVLPNTEKLFKKWWSNLARVLFMFPLITGMLAMAILFQEIAGASPSATVQLAGTVAPLIALTLIPKTFKWGGDAFAGAAGFAAGYATKATNWGKDKAAGGAKSLAGNIPKTAMSSDRGQKIAMGLASNRISRNLGGKTLQRKFAGERSARLGAAGKLTEDMNGSQLQKLAMNGNYQEKTAAIGQLAKQGNRKALLALSKETGSTGAAYNAASAKFGSDFGKNADLKRTGGSYTNMASLSNDALAQLNPDAFKANIANGNITHDQLANLDGDARAKNMMSPSSLATLTSYRAAAPTPPSPPGSPPIARTAGHAAIQADISREIAADPSKAENYRVARYVKKTRPDGTPDTRASDAGYKGA
ncbi:MAG: hypothetical protein WCI47_03205 [bacterium]